MGSKLDIKIGDIVFIKVENGSNAARKITPMTVENIDRWLFEREVSAIGRKYITVKWSPWTEEKFNIEDDYRQKYTSGGADYKLYTSKQEVLDEMESEEIYLKLKSEFSNHMNKRPLTLDQLRRISKIVNE